MRNKFYFPLSFAILFFFVVFWFGLFGLNGTISSGFHIVDMHEIPQMNQDLVNADGHLFSVIKKWVTNDLASRVRPMYQIDNVIMYTSLGKGNLVYISVYKILCCILSAFLLFMGTKRLGFSTLSALGVPMLAMLGTHAGIWITMGPNEGIGMVYLSLTIFAMSFAIQKGKWEKTKRVSIVVLMILTALCKESFFVLLPSLMMGYIVLLKYKRGFSWKQTLVRYSPELIILTIYIILETALILTQVKTENLGYAGIKGNTYIQYVNAGVSLITESGIGIVGGILYLAALVCAAIKRGKRKKNLTFLLLGGIVIGAGLLSQAYIYGKSGIFDRYFLPGMLLNALLLIGSLEMIKRIFPLTPKQSTLWTPLLTLFLVLLAITPLSKSIKRAKAFTLEGKHTELTLSAIASNTDSTQTVLFVSDIVADFERTISFRRYLSREKNLNNIYTLPIMPEQVSEEDKVLLSGFEWVMGGEWMHFNYIPDKSNISTIVFFAKWQPMAHQILQKNGINPDEYVSVNIPPFEVFYKVDKTPFISESYHIAAMPADKEIYRETTIELPPLRQGSILQISIRPSDELTEAHKAFLILLDKEDPSRIEIHDPITGSNEILLERALSNSISHPVLIFRNWSPELTTPETEITLSASKRPGLRLVPKNYFE